MALTRWEIKAALGHGGAKEIARRVGKSAPQVSEVIAGRRRDRAVEVAIARKIGKPVAEVFEPDTVKAGAA